MSVGAGASAGRGAAAGGACPDEEALLAYLEAGPAGGGSPALGAHVDRCERCRQVVAALGPLPLYGEASGEAGADDASAFGRPPAPAGGASGGSTLVSAAAGAGPGAWAGRVLAGKYRVLGELGRGGMGVVLEAEHVAVAERFAVKLVRAGAGGGGGGVRRLLREARLAAQVGGRHVARVYDVGALDDGTMFLVMERLYGEDLQAALRRRGALPVGEALGYMLQACEAVGRAHAAGVIHRDLKPANLFLAKEETGGLLVKVLDFGLAKLAERPRLEGEQSLTTSSTVIGSPRYMSPEQIRDARGVDERSDVWALGVILFEMLAGEPPFAGTTVSGLWASIVADPPRPLRGLRPEVPAALAGLVEACLVKDPAERLASVAELARRVREARAGAERVEAARPGRGRRRLGAALGAAAALGLTSLGVAYSRGALGGGGAGPGLAAPSRGEAMVATGGAPVTGNVASAGPGAAAARSPDAAAGPPAAARSFEAPPAAPSAQRPATSAAAAAGRAPGPGAAKRPERGRGNKEPGPRVHEAASDHEVFFGKETESRH